ncbi:hypothetical protein V6N13_023870 [Hibiscus sabdariffa]|uniref:Uncharacterized protein n=1 Tax=Hibiscus sabdariffa TaxID=183260 RepID=A0ABR2PN24_9ROSI
MFDSFIVSQIHGLTVAEFIKGGKGFFTIALGSVATFLVTPLLRATNLATAGQMAVLVCDLFFKSTGAGGIRPCSMPFGVDQLSNKSEMNLESYFGWYHADASLDGSLGFDSCCLRYTDI